MRLIEDGDEEQPATRPRWRWPMAGAAAAVAVILAGAALLFSRQPPPDWEITAPGVGPAEPGPVSGGTFAAAAEPFDLFVGVSRADYPTVAVTLEPLDGDPSPSGVFVFGPGP